MDNQNKKVQIIQELPKVIKHHTLIYFRKKIDLSLLYGKPAKRKQKIPKNTSRSRYSLKEWLAILIIGVGVILYVGLTVKVLLAVTTTDDLMAVIQVIFPFLIALLTPILHYLFDQEQNDDGEDR